MADLDTLFQPKSIAIVGASTNPEKIGHSIVRNLVDSGYRGKIYPVNPKAVEILGLRCYPNISSLPEPVDVAVVSVPSSLVLGVAEECGRRGTKNLVVITAGFKEIGQEGLRLEKELVQICKRYGMRMVGPNCLGIMDTHTPLNASFARGFPLKGEIAFISQSGALCGSILDWSLDKGVGFSKFISLGNKADLNEADFIAYAAQDESSRVIVCYIEDVANGEQFLRAAREASKKTPVIILKSGTSQAGAQAASSHTGALAGSDKAYDTAFKQAGVLRAKSMTELFDLAIAFATQPIPRGDGVAIVTNSGGPGIIATDAVEDAGLRMTRFSKDTIDDLRSNLPPESNIYNPIDIIGDADPERYRFALEKALSDPGVDSVVVLLTPTAVLDPLETARVIKDVRSRWPNKPLAAAYMGGISIGEGVHELFESRIPTYTFPEPAIRAIAGLTRYGQFLRRPSEKELTFEDVDADRVRQIFEAVKRDNRVVLLGSETAQVAAAYGIKVAETRLARSPREAADLAEAMGYPVVMKVASPMILHKTDVGGVKVGLHNAQEVESAYVDILDNVHRYMRKVEVYGVEVQKMMPKGVELIVGMTRDVQFGPLLAFGLGGIYVNLLQDVSFRLADGLSPTMIREMIEETKAAVLLRGFRGEKARDLDAVMDTVARVAQLVRDFPEIAEMEINPLVAYVSGVSALDVKITLA